MKSSIYLVRDMVSHANSDLSLAVSDAAAIRSFGLQLISSGIDHRLAADLMLVRLGSLDYNDGSNYPTICGYDCPVPVCYGLEAMDSVKDGTEDAASV